MPRSQTSLSKCTCSKHRHTMAGHHLLDACLAEMKYEEARPEQKTRLILNVVEMVQEQQYRLVKHGLKTLLDEVLYELYREMIRIAYGMIKGIQR